MASNTRKVSATFTRNGIAVNPDAVTLTVGGVLTAVLTWPGTLTNDSAGVFSTLLTPLGPGTVRCQWDCTYTGPPEVKGRAVFAFYPEPL